jgi:hypothetical protein
MRRDSEDSSKRTVRTPAKLVPGGREQEAIRSDGRRFVPRRSQRHESENAIEGLAHLDEQQFLLSAAPEAITVDVRIIASTSRPERFLKFP